MLGLKHIPASRHIHVLYEELALNPRAVAQQIVNQVPGLEYLDFGDDSEMKGAMNYSLQNKLPKK